MNGLQNITNEKKDLLTPDKIWKTIDNNKDTFIGFAGDDRKFERFKSQIFTYLSVNRQLVDNYNISIKSVLHCLYTAIELNLSFNSALGEFYVVPYKGVATPIVGYKGYLKKALVSDSELSYIATDCIFKKDNFKKIEHFVEGEYRREFSIARHEPNDGEEVNYESDSNLKGLYAVAVYKNNSGRLSNWIYMTAEEIKEFRDKSPSYKAYLAKKKEGKWQQEPIWDLYFKDMARKTVIRKLCTSNGMISDSRVHEIENAPYNGKVAYITKNEVEYIDVENTQSKTAGVDDVVLGDLEGETTGHDGNYN